MKPPANPLAAARPALAALALAVALQGQAAPPSAAPTSAPAAGPAAWRPLIIVDPRTVLRSPAPHAAAQQRPVSSPHAGRRTTAAPRAVPSPEVFERYDTAPRPGPTPSRAS